MKKRRIHIYATLCLVQVGLLVAQDRAKTPTLAERTSSFEKKDGFIPYYWDANAGKIWLEVSSFDAEFLYVHSLPAGVGSNDIGLDRGQLGGEHVVTFTRSGPKVLLVEPNYRYRATAERETERRAVREAFASSVLWGFDVVMEEGGRVLVDATSFFLRDAHDVVGTLKRSNQGTYRLDASRSAFYLPRTKNFPRNSEVEVILTFAGDQPGGWVRSVVPSPEAVTVRQRHSFVQLPDSGYTPRVLDPRAGYFGISYMDFSVPIGEPVMRNFIARHRLEKKDPSSSMSEPVRPIVYYVDPGVPEPVRTALIDGASWWDQAFEAAGYRNSFRVEVLPDDADPMDVRYNVIQWVHRSTRGWSYGGSVSDPRTGEIIKGHVSLGSLRVRQDFLIAEGLLAPYEEGKPVSPKMERMALARLRQLSAHEVGHTIGLAHNYIASTSDRASVMDYPHPYATLRTDGSIDLSSAYGEGIGDWDKLAVAYGYQDFADGVDESKALQDIIADGMRRHLTFLSDQDARPQGSAHPATHLWDNGSNAVDELARIMQVRSAALRRFSDRVIRPGMPMATLEEALVPLYLGHRYQVEAASKTVGGVWYSYAMRGDGQETVRTVEAAEQRRAVREILKTISPEALQLSPEIVRLIPPRPFAYPSHRELFASRTGLTFDALAPSEAAAQHVLRLLLDPERASRLVEQNAVDQKQVSLEDVLNAVTDVTWRGKPQAGFAGEVQRTVNNVALTQMFSLAGNERTLPQVRERTTMHLKDLKGWMSTALTRTTDKAQRAHYAYAIDLMERYFKDPSAFPVPKPVEIPPGQPIGCGEDLL